MQSPILAGVKPPAWANPPRLCTPLCFVIAALILAYPATSHAGSTRAALGDNAFGVLHNGHSLFLECSPPPASTRYLQKYLANDAEWTVYRGRRTVAIPFDRVEPAVQRSILLALFDHDVVDAKGWLHTVGSSEEIFASLCQWLTGDSANQAKILAANGVSRPELLQGQQLLFPLALLREVMKQPTPDRTPPVLGEPEDSAIDLSISLEMLDTAAGELTYGVDKQGRYAAYRLKPGEALYTAVVVRFTDYSEPKDVLAACDVVQRRSAITNVHGMPPGQRILIPLEMLANRFKPQDSPERREYEQVVKEARRLKGQVRSLGLEGVVIVLDPGHGGRDYGASSPRDGLFEDEITYDIAYRAKRVLETQTRAKVYMTLYDPNQGDEPSPNSRFTHDTDEKVLTTPPYHNGLDTETDAKVSANLRWSLANAIYKRERARGADPRKMVFTSFHCDALFNGKPRGTMVYIPGASLRRDETLSGATYRPYQEVREGGRSMSSPVERRRDEALSRNFAEILLDELGKKRIRRHQEGDPIRSQIRKSPTNVYVPAVLRNTMIPTKVLVETANLTNPTDRARLADHQWRQAFAEAYVEALKRNYADTGATAEASSPRDEGQALASWAEDSPATVELPSRIAKTTEANPTPLILPALGVTPTAKAEPSLPLRSALPAPSSTRTKPRIVSSTTKKPSTTASSRPSQTKKVTPPTGKQPAKTAKVTQAKNKTAAPTTARKVTQPPSANSKNPAKTTNPPATSAKKKTPTSTRSAAPSPTKSNPSSKPPTKSSPKLTTK